MKKTLLILFVFLISCSPVPRVAPVIESTSTAQPTSQPIFTSTPQRTATTPATIPPTVTPIPCDPHTVEYCITDGHLILQRPIRPPANSLIDGTYRYASTANGTRDPHHGVEIGGDYGTPVYTAADGVVMFAGPDKVAVYGPWTNFYGNMIVIRHADDLFTLYAHLSRIEVQAGQVVQVGEKVGEVGQTGAATGSHLHFEVRQGEVEDYFSTVNPELWLLPIQAEFGAVAVSVVDEKGNLQRARLTVENHSDSAEVLAAYYLDTYHPQMAVREENAALSDLPPGRYRIALIQNGYLYERWVAVQSGKLTQVVIVVK